MGMRIEYTIFLMMRLKSFRPDIDKKLAAHAGIPEKKTGIKLKYKVRNSKKSKLSNKKQKNT
jgi:hypothetical protein